MKKTFSRILSVLLCVIMAVGILPLASHMTAHAYVTGDDYPYSKGDKSAYLFYTCQCTDFVAHCLNTRNGIAFNAVYGNKVWGNAKEWKAVAESLGFTVDHNPAVGAVAYWSSTSSSGHVAWVRSINSDGTVFIEEYNHPSAYNGNTYSTYNQRDNVTAEYYIHIRDLSEPFIISDSDTDSTGGTSSTDSGTGSTDTGTTDTTGSGSTDSADVVSAEQIEAIVSSLISFLKAAISYIVKLVKSFM